MVQSATTKQPNLVKVHGEVTDVINRAFQAGVPQVKGALLHLAGAKAFVGAMDRRLDTSDEGTARGAQALLRTAVDCFSVAADEFSRSADQSRVLKERNDALLAAAKLPDGAKNAAIKSEAEEKLNALRSEIR
jgi:hypothetical protein